MKTISHIIALIIIALSFNACTHNNGDIGDIFGTWKLESITINGENDTTYQNNILWKFQASIISMIRANDITHDRLETWGSWSFADDETKLLLNFTHTDDYNPNMGSTKYSPLPETYLPKSTTSTLSIITLNGDNMILLYNSEDGNKYIFKFKKWG